MRAAGPARGGGRRDWPGLNRWTPSGCSATIGTVTNESERQASSGASSKRVRFVEVPGAAMTALLDGDGYTVVPESRRQGYARAMLAELLRRAAAEPAVRIVRATISPGNAASLATIAGFGFVEAGEQWDEENGLELIFEIPAGHGPEQPVASDGRQPACGGCQPA